MADENEVVSEENSAYAAPAPKTVNDIMSLDKGDESLEGYKKKLLGDNPMCIVFESDPRKVIVMKIALLVDGRPDNELDLSGNLANLKKCSFVLKEACKYRVKIYFYVQRDIVSGLKYRQRIYRKGISVDKEEYMLGSYGPQDEMHTYLTPVEEAPSGLLARGTYTVKSLFTDVDQNEHLKWEWCMDIKKDWN